MTARRGAARLALLVTLALGASACSLLYPEWPMEELDPMPFPGSTAMVTYTVGSATVEVDQDGVGEQLVLDELGPSSRLEPMFGATVNWRNGDGWFMVVTAYDHSAYGDPTFGGGVSGDLTIQRVSDNEIWSTGAWGEFGNRCIIDFDEMSEVAIRGTATCHGLRWTDGATGYTYAEPSFIDGQAPFDAVVTFEALPTDSRPTNTT